jgi:CheY-like chemotaxis protein
VDGLRVLVIDDLEDAREAFWGVLKSLGAQVQAAATAAEGLTVLSRFKPDALLCDIAMPEMDRLSLIRKVRALKPGQGGKVPAVALTAFNRDENVLRRRSTIENMLSCGSNRLWYITITIATQAACYDSSLP